MKRIILYIIVLALSLVIPEHGTDAGKLIPVEVIHLYIDEDRVVIETDAGPWGQGNSVGEAVADLGAGASGVVFLDTAKYLLVEDTALDRVEAIGTYLKESVRVCKAERGTDLVRAAEYLDVHPPKVTIKVAKITEIQEKLEQTDNKQKIT